MEYLMADDSSGKIEAVLFKAADNLHRNIDALEYKKPIAGTYHNWRNKDCEYENIKGFCKSESIEKVWKLDYVLTPSRYVGMIGVEDDFDFAERFTQLKAEFEEQLKEEAELNRWILANLENIDLKKEQ
jgi:type I restriction enzyme M protein